MTRFRFDCAYCDELVVTDTVDAVKREAKAHLETHRTELKEVFTVAFGGTNCYNDCGFVFPEEVDDEVGFDCPACGHDNFPPFVHQYVYWRIEKTPRVTSSEGESDGGR
ncbi:hypothetical protein [Halorussus salinisoli]|uniref:hypothetical protein n=1 Tax=Halorussus salinisoli TaxID=2558242 RepID=UPI0010C18404|nr:hypothetical protein [Halorussus salinisoli]